MQHVLAIHFTRRFCQARAEERAAYTKAHSETLQAPRDWSPERTGRMLGEKNESPEMTNRIVNKDGCWYNPTKTSQAVKSVGKARKALKEKEVTPEQADFAIHFC